MDNLFLEEADSDDLLKARLPEDSQSLRQKFEEFDSFPPEAKRALLDMHFNLGVGQFSQNYKKRNPATGKIEEKGWPKLFGHVKNGDWAKAAFESNRADIGSTRNKWVKDLLNAAQERIDRQPE